MPGLRTVGQRVCVLEDRESRNSLFRSWMGKEHAVTCHTTLRTSIEDLYKEKSHFLFLDFDIHDRSDRTLREWLGVDPWRKELDGLDLATYVAKRLAPEKRPDHIIIHSRNPIGRRLMREYLERKGFAPLLWAFDYTWTGLDGTTVPPPKPPKVYVNWDKEEKRKPSKKYTTREVTDQLDFWLGGPRKNKKKKAPKVEEPSRFPVGSKVRLTSEHLEATGEIGSNVRRWFTVMPCACPLCSVGDYVAVDEPNEYTDLKYRHIATGGLRALGHSK